MRMWGIFVATRGSRARWQRRKPTRGAACGYEKYTPLVSPGKTAKKLVLTRKAPCLQSGSCVGEHCAMYGTLSAYPRLNFPRKSGRQVGGKDAAGWDFLCTELGELGSLPHTKIPLAAKILRLWPRLSRGPIATQELTVNFGDAKEQIRQKVDIVDLVGSSISLKRSGRGYAGLCPWHDDSKPSLQVNPDRQTWKCWVCDIGGDIFSFAMKRDGLDFVEALKMLAERAGINLDE